MNIEFKKKPKYNLWDRVEIISKEKYLKLGSPHCNTEGIDLYNLDQLSKADIFGKEVLIVHQRLLDSLSNGGYYCYGCLIWDRNGGYKNAGIGIDDLLIEELLQRVKDDENLFTKFNIGNTVLVISPNDKDFHEKECQITSITISLFLDGIIGTEYGNDLYIYAVERDQPGLEELPRALQSAPLSLACRKSQLILLDQDKMTYNEGK